MFPNDNIAFFPVGYTITYPDATSVLLPVCTFATVAGNPARGPTNRNWVFTGQNIVPRLADLPEAEFHTFQFRYDFSTCTLFPFSPDIRSGVSGTLSFNRSQQVYNANRYVSVTQESSEPWVITFSYRIPSCLLREKLPTSIDFRVDVHDCTYGKCFFDIFCCTY